LLILIIILISACGTPKKENITEIRTIPIDRQNLILPQITPINPRQVDWKIVTPENVNKIFEDMKNSNQEMVLIALTTTGYENISLNMAEIMRLLVEKDAIIVAYKNYYEKTDQAIIQNNLQTQN
jgi:hypothetical protein